MKFLSKFFGNKEAEFQKQVIRTLQSDLVQPSSNPMHVCVAGVELDLSELYKICTANEVQSADFIRQYFSFPLAFVHQEDRSWNDVESALRPQLVPIKMAKQFDIQLFDFVEPVAASVVIKADGDQRFVRPEDLKRWNVSPEEIFNRAIVNLDSDKVETEVTITDGSDRFIGLESHDGFDAARILLPRVRDLASAKLGAPYFAGFPNRDFLILWSKECSPRFQEYASEKIETDYSIHSFPLTPLRFEVNEQTLSVL